MTLESYSRIIYNDYNAGIAIYDRRPCYKIDANQ